MTATEGLSQVNTLATHTALTAWGAASDFLVILILLGVFFLFAWYVGRGPFIAVLLAFYSAYALYITFPYSSLLPSAPPLTSLLAHLGLYLGLTFGFYVILRRVVVSDFLYIGLFGLIALSFFGATFLIALAYHGGLENSPLFPIGSVYTFTSAIDALFAPAQYFWWWFVAPAVGLFFLAR